MNDEFDRLRDVAWASAAFIKADDDFESFMRPWHEQRDPKPTNDVYLECGRLTELRKARRRDLVQALARLADVNPDILPR